MTNLDTVEKDHGTRIICAKLYEGGLFWANSILSGLQRDPFVGKSPETGLDVDLISRHAEKAIEYHLNYAMITAAIALLGIVVYFINPIVTGIVIAIDAAIISWKSKYLDRKIAIDNFSKKAYNPNYWLESTQVTQIPDKDTSKQNVIIFGEFYPFLGAGHRVRNWNLVVDTSKPSKSLDISSSPPKDISVEELYKVVNEEVQAKNLPNITHEYLLFADGKELDSTFLLPHRVSDEPISYLDQSIVLSKGHEGLYNEYRTYYSVKYFDKVRSTLLSNFLRFSKIGKEIFIECCFYVLTPIDEDKFNIDKIPLYDEMIKLKAAIIAASLALLVMALSIDSTLVLLPLIIVSVAAILPIINLYLGKYNEGKVKNRLMKRIEKGEPHNYGRKKTYRESISSPNYKNYFSAQDVIMVQNSIDQAIIYAIAGLLDSKGIDSSLLREDLLSFVNQGIMMFGGTLEAGQVSVGKGAKAIQAARQQVENIINIPKVM